MSNYESSSSKSWSHMRGRIMGVLKRCWCGSGTVALISKSEHNPYRCYYRCGYAAFQNLTNDNYTFKWVDIALLDEIESLQGKNVRFEKEVREILKEREELEQVVFEKVLVKLEKEIFERVEDVLVESSWNMKKMMILVLIGCMTMIGLNKLLD